MILDPIHFIPTEVDARRERLAGRWTPQPRQARRPRRPRRHGWARLAVWSRRPAAA